MRAASLIVTALQAWSDATNGHADGWITTAVYGNGGPPPPPPLLVDFDAATAHYAAVGASRALARPRRERPRTRVTPTAPRARERADWSTMPRRAPRRI